ncbi:MBL fold metallo-hydrolase [Domibacillus sp. 8LH]|uniref:MBL fold metallo-hydrolase n=1 Tax=Domibacillus sp. 8LH TaxID=3073900 RepID=UPI003177D5A1
MFFTSFFDERLAQYTYLVGCQKTGEAIVIDPARHVAPFIEKAEKEGLNITAIAETHIHADFLSGSIELAEKTGAKMYLSDEGNEDWKYQFIDRYDVELVKDGSIIHIGKVKMEVWHTPGHTPESISLLLKDEGGGSSVPMGMFTGDFVFVGDIGRPDLLEKAANMQGTAQSGAKDMFQSIQRFKELPDYVLVWPAHGAGSACGKSLGAVPLSTVGYEKVNNWALKIDNEDSFIKELLSDQPEAPKYFSMMKKMNKEGPASLPTETPKVMGDVGQLDVRNISFLDARPAKEFAEHHLKGAYNIPLNKSFTNWAGWLLPYDRDIVAVISEEQQEDMLTALQSIGLDQVKSVIRPKTAEQGGETIAQITAEEFSQIQEGQLIDVRNHSEWKEGHHPEAEHIMLGDLPDEISRIKNEQPVIVQCQAGSRSAIAASVLKARGVERVINLQGGYKALQKHGIVSS